MADTEQPDFTAMTVQLLSAYFSNNQVPAGDIAGIIEATRGALERKAEMQAPAAAEHVPAVSVRKSLGSRDHIISMIDGKPYKALKRHLATNGLTPAEYRERYNLPKDYPMVAPAYSEHRRAVAQKLGLGRKVGAQAQEEAPVTEQAPAAVVPSPEPVKEVKPRRTPARAVAAKPASEAPAAASEPTPPVTVAPEPAPVPVKTKVAAPKAVKKKEPVKKTTVKKAAPKASTAPQTPVPVEEAAVTQTGPENITTDTAAPEPVTPEATKPARKKKLGIATGSKPALSSKPKGPKQRARAAQKDEIKGADTASDEKPVAPKRSTRKKAVAAPVSEVTVQPVSGKG
ncbi:MucR family transcriptional regulator [Sphingobium yanoikuyae]|uniref:MucR family transcriptional regulator n=1 Tax=Sphingobium yanoikuyae TaxID=13690 RepID=A0A9X7U6J0_SPHYA|nr:MucR family transcriptional regulator [Sphingobium yanoikuyae]QNG43559.1 MucR family transcriptional regulator [Sphingobium yanoikuyae]